MLKKKVLASTLKRIYRVLITLLSDYIESEKLDRVFLLNLDIDKKCKTYVHTF